MAGPLVPMDRLSDRGGNRRNLLSGLAVFAAAAAFSQTHAVLLTSAAAV